VQGGQTRISKKSWRCRSSDLQKLYRQTIPISLGIVLLKNPIHSKSSGCKSVTLCMKQILQMCVRKNKFLLPWNTHSNLSWSRAYLQDR